MITQEDKDRLTGATVKIDIHGRTTEGIVRGRLLPFASVWIPGRETHGEIVYSWDTIDRAVRTGATLKV